MALENDWIVAGINNPSFTPGDFAIYTDMNTANTQFMSEDYYLRSPFIRENPMFANENGEFSKDKFTEFYNQKAYEYYNFYNNDYSTLAAVSPFDYMRTQNTPVMDIQFRVERVFNPDRYGVSMEGVNEITDPKFSQRELAKQQRVFNYETGQFEDYTVNDHTLVKSPVEWFKALFQTPLVLATWDEDGTHVDPMLGIQMEHHKGEAKLNENGTYYYETLGDRAYTGKDVLSLFDTFTVDGEGVNKYDFFDSNDIHKSAGGTIMKNVASILPMFIPGFNAFWFRASVIREIGRALPTLYGIMTAWNDSPTPTILDKFNAMSSKLTSSQSDYARQHFMAFENIGNIIGDVALQWGQQQAIAEIYNSLRGVQGIVAEAEGNARKLFAAKMGTWAGSEEELWQVCYNKFVPAAAKLVEEANASTRNLTTLYMGILLNDQVYEEMLDKGCSKQEAAAIALGSILGTYAIDRGFHLSEQFLRDESGNFVNASRKAIREEIDKASTKLINEGTITGPKVAESQPKLVVAIQSAIASTKKALSNIQEDLAYHAGNLITKVAVGGFQNMAEVLSSDVSKSLYELAGQFGFDTNVSEVGAWENTLERYVMNFLGGALGAGIFYGKEIWDAGTFKKPTWTSETATLIRNGYGKNLRDEVNRLYNEGKLGSKILGTTFTTTEKGERVYHTAQNEEDSQAYALKSAILGNLNAIEAVIKGNENANLSDDQLFDQMVLSEKRFAGYKGLSEFTDYYSLYAEAEKELVDAELAWKQAQLTVDGDPDGDIPLESKQSRELRDSFGETRKENLEKARERLEKARREVAAFKSGDKSREYARLLLFLGDPNLHAAFVSKPVTTLVEEKIRELYAKEGRAATDADWMQAAADAHQEVSKALKENWKQGFQKFLEYEAMTHDSLERYAEDASNYKVVAADINDLIDPYIKGLENIKNRLHTDARERLNGETEGEWREAVTQKEGESNEKYQQRMMQRAAQMGLQYHNELTTWAQEFYNAIVDSPGFRVDPLTVRRVQMVLDDVRVVDVIRNEIEMMKSTNQIHPKLASFALENLSLLRPGDPGVEERLNEILSRWRQMVAEGSDITVEAHDALANLGELEVKNVSAKADGTQVDQWDDGTTLSEALATLFRTYQYDDNSDFESIHDLKLSGLIKFVNSHVGKEINFSNDTIQKIEDQIEKIGKISPDLLQMDLWSIVEMDGDYADGNDQTWMSYVQNVGQESADALRNMLTEVIDHPIVKLMHELGSIANLKNPAIELVRDFMKHTGANIGEQDFEDIMQKLSSDFENIDDISKFEIDSTLLSKLRNVQVHLEMLMRYIYAASTDATRESGPYGHNRQINDFTRNHKDQMETEWQMLPEIDVATGSMINTYLQELSDQIDTWIRRSEQNQVNRIYRAVATDRAVCKATNAWLNGLESIRSFKIGDKTYDLLEGYTPNPISEYEQVEAFNIETTIHDNIKKICKDNSLTIKQLLDNEYNLLDIFDINFNNVANQLSTALSSEITSEKLTDFSKLIHVATILSADPREFYKYLKKDLDSTQDTNGVAVLAPITTQEMAARYAQASGTSTFRDIMRYAYKKSGAKTPLLDFCFFIQGMAGVGKSVGVCRLVDLKYKEKDARVLGPNLKCAVELMNAIGRKKCASEVDFFLKDILGEDEFNDITNEIESARGDKDGRYEDGKYFTFKEEDGHTVVNLKETEIKFRENKDSKLAVIYIDEATQIDNVRLQLINLYASRHSISVYLLGDTGQLTKIVENGGYESNSNPSLIESLGEGVAFMPRSSPLTVSLRTANLQTYINNNALRTIIDEIQKIYIDPNVTLQQWDEYGITIKDLLHKVRLRSYTTDDINGAFVTRSISSGMIDMLKTLEKSGNTIAFVGDQNSTLLTNLRDKGVKIGDVYDKYGVMGREFDYVIIDSDVIKPINQDSKMADVRRFCLEFYSMMTRAKQGSIFIDAGYQDIFGSPIFDGYKVEAPSLAPAIEQIRKIKRENLNRMNLNAIQETETETETEEVETEEGDNSTNEKVSGGDDNGDAVNNEKKVVSKKKTEKKTKERTEIVTFEANSNDCSDPDEGVDLNTMAQPQQVIEENEQLPPEKKAINTAILTDIVYDPDSSNYISYLVKQIQEHGCFPIEIFGDVTDLSVEIDANANKTQSQKRGADKRGEHEIIENEVWVVRKPKDGVLRNCQALGKANQRYSTYAEKLALQDLLYDMKSAIAFEEDYDILPSELKSIFTRETWESGGRLLLEFRKFDPKVDRLPMNTTLKTIGLEYNNERIISNLVFEINDIDGRVCRFDLGGLNNPETLRNFVNERLVPSISDDNASLKQLVNSARDGYETWFNAQCENCLGSENGIVEIELPNDSNIIQSARRTWFVQLDNFQQLGGKISANDFLQMHRKLGDDIKSYWDYNNFRHRNTALYISKPYIFGDKEFEQIDKSLIGRCVVFVTARRSYRQRPQIDIVTDYINQKTNPKEGEAPIRMIVLGNYGLSFSQLISSEFMSEFTGRKASSDDAEQEYIDSNSSEEDESQRIIRQNHIGIRMYTSLRNARAALTKLHNALEDFKKTNNLSDDNIKKLAEADWMLSQHQDVKTFLKDNSLTIDQLSAFQKFNSNDIRDEVRMFRIGFCENGRGHIQEFEVDGSVLYPRGTQIARFVTIDVDLLDKYLKLSRNILNYIDNAVETINADQNDERMGLDTRLLKADGSLFAEDEYIDPKDPNLKHRATIAGLLKHVDGENGREMVIRGADGKDVIVPEGENWTCIPKVVGQYLKTIYFLQYNTNNDYDVNQVKKTVKFKSRNDIGEEIELPVTTFDFTEVVGDNGILDASIITDEKTSIDTSLSDLFDFVFHGTIEDFHTRRSDGTKVIQATDAYLKHGFYTDPGATFKDGKPLVLSIGDNRCQFFETNIREELLTTDVGVRQSGWRFYLDNLLKYQNGLKNTPTNVEENNEINIQNSVVSETAKTTQIPEVNATESNKVEQEAIQEPVVEPVPEPVVTSSEGEGNSGISDVYDEESYGEVVKTAETGSSNLEDKIKKVQSVVDDQLINSIAETCNVDRTDVEEIVQKFTNIEELKEYILNNNSAKEILGTMGYYAEINDLVDILEGCAI